MRPADPAFAASAMVSPGSKTLMRTRKISGCDRRVFQTLIDPQKEASGDGRHVFFALANKEWLPRVARAQARNQSAASRIGHCILMEQVFIGARETIRAKLPSVRMFLVGGILNRATRSDADFFAGVEVHQRVHPLFRAVQINLSRSGDLGIRFRGGSCLRRLCPRSRSQTKQHRCQTESRSRV